MSTESCYSWSEILKIGLGQCGLSPVSFWSMTMEEYNAVIEGKRELIENAEMQNWNRSRWQALTMLSPHVPKGKKISLTDLAVFPWEKSTVKSNKPTKEELEASLERIRERDKDKWVN